MDQETELRLKRYRSACSALRRLEGVQPFTKDALNKIQAMLRSLTAKSPASRTEWEIYQIALLERLSLEMNFLLPKIEELVAVVKKRIENHPNICPICCGEKFIYDANLGVSKKCPRCRGSGNHNSPAQA